MVIEFKYVVDVVVSILICCFEISFIVEARLLAHLFKELKVFRCYLPFLFLLIVILLVDKSVLGCLVDVVFFELFSLLCFCCIFVAKFVANITLWFRAWILRINGI